MPSTVADLFAAAHVEAGPDSPVRWNEPVPEDGSGVYVIALDEDVHSFAEHLPVAPLDEGRVAELLRVREAELRIDGEPPSAAELEDRLRQLWLGDESILYVGLAGASLRHRVGAYYRTPLGARRPHAGGWPLKTLKEDVPLWVHFAACDEPGTAEHVMLDAFMRQASPALDVALVEGRPLPFANLEWGKGQAKEHGITGAREPRRPRSAASPAGDDPSAESVPGSPVD
jgi:hypothetical protein